MNAIYQIRAAEPNARIIVLTTYDVIFRFRVRGVKEAIIGALQERNASDECA